MKEANMNLCETCKHYKECGTRLIISVIENDVKCKAYEPSKEKKYRNLIICGFPGVGKSTAAERCKSVLDLESTPYHSTNDLNWFSKYVDAIENYVNDVHYNYILVSTHKLVRDEMQYRGIPYIIVTPLIKLKDEYLARYIKRGDPYSFVELINGQWESWIEDFAYDDMPIIHLDAGENISKLFPIPNT